MISDARASNRPALWLALGLWVLTAWWFPFFPALGSPNELTRLYLTRAIVDDASFSIDGPVARYGRLTDMAGHEGRLYSDKAPGIGLLGVPIYAALKAAAGWEAGAIDNGPLLRWLRIWLAGLPTALCALLLWFLLGRSGLKPALRGTLVAAYGLGSIAFAYGTLLFGHQAATCCLLGGYALAERNTRAPRPWLAPAAGACLGLGLAIEYTSLLLVVPLAAVAVWRSPRRGRDLVAGLLGAVVPLGVLAVYHWICFGAPWASGYGQLVQPHYAQVHGSGALGLQAPSLSLLATALFSPTRGLWFFSPWLALALPALGLALVRPIPSVRRADWLAFATGSIFYLLFAAALHPDAWGWSLGPRHLAPLVPFWTLALGDLLARPIPSARGTLWLLRALTLPAVLAIPLAVAAFGGFPPDFSNPLADFTGPLLLAGCTSPSPAGLLGLEDAWGLLVFAPVLLAAAAWIGFRGPGSLAGKVAAAGLALALVAAAFGLRGANPPQEARALTWVQHDILHCGHASPPPPAPSASDPWGPPP